MKRVAAKRLRSAAGSGFECWRTRGEGAKRPPTQDWRGRGANGASDEVTERKNGGESERGGGCREETENEMEDLRTNFSC